MKRYEKMTKKEIIDFFATDCGMCDLSSNCARNMSCEEIKKEWLNEEIKTVPLITTINSVEKLREAAEDHKNHCRIQGECKGCDYFSDFSRNCFARYLEQEVEV